MRTILFVAAAAVCGPLLWAAAPQKDGPTTIRRAGDGKLVYAVDRYGNTIPDFSLCGYEAGRTKIPDVPVRETVWPVEGDAGKVIQEAIDKVSALAPDEDGFRGTVLLKRGRYSVAGELSIKASGVVLRGEGADDTGTILVAAGRGQRTLISVGTAGKPREVKGTRRPVADAFVPVGARTLNLDSAAGFRVGDRVIVHRPSTREWIHAIGMDQLPPRKDGGPVTQWTPGSKDLFFDRVVAAVNGNELSLDAPITCALDQKFGGGSVYKYEFSGRIHHVGVENLRGVSEYKGETDEDHGWVFVGLDGVEHGWVRDVTAVHFGRSCVWIRQGSKWVTVQRCICLDPISKIEGERRYSFNLDGQLCLVEHCRARNGRHDYVTGSTVEGPNAFVDCTAEMAHADIGPHQRWAVGILYDNVVTDGEINVRNRGNRGSGQGWAGANHVLWNCRAAAITCEKPPTAHNWAIGCIAEKREGNGEFESFGRPVQPVSLYRAQHAERYGK
jgi:hypothetical protein